MPNLKAPNDTLHQESPAGIELGMDAALNEHARELIDLKKH
jgi:hypothetical protein